MPRRDSHLPSHPGGHYYYPSSSAGGVDAWTKAESDARYFRPDVGGEIRGNVIFAGEVRDPEGLAFTRIKYGGSAPGTGDHAPEGTLWAYTGLPNVEPGEGTSQVQVEDDYIGPAAATLLKFQGDVLRMVGSVAELDLDGRYLLRDEASSWYYTKAEADSRYFRPDVGGTIQGYVVFAGEVEDTDGRAFSRLEYRDRAPGVSDEAPEGTLWAYTGLPNEGPGVGNPQVQVEDDNTPATTASLLKFQGDVLSMAGDIAEISFDSLYYPRGEVDALLATKANAGHNHDSRYLRLTGGTLTGNLGGQMFRSSRPVATNWALVAQMETDSQPRWFVEAQGRMRWGDGAGTNLGMVWPSEGYLRSSVGFYAEGASIIAPDAPTPLTLRRNNSQNNVTILWENSAGDRIYAGMRTANSFAIGRSANLSDSPWISVSPNRITAPVIIEAPEIYDPESRPYSRLEISDRAPGTGDHAPEGTLWAYTGLPDTGDGGVSPQVQVEDDNTGATTARLLKFQGDVLSVSSGIATFNLDGRYSQVGHSHTAQEVGALPITGGRVQGAVTVESGSGMVVETPGLGKYSRAQLTLRHPGAAADQQAINILHEIVDEGPGSDAQFYIRHVKEGGAFSNVLQYRAYSEALDLYGSAIRLNSDNVRVRGNTVWHAGNFDPGSKLNISGGTLSGSLSVGSGSNGVQVNTAGFINLYRGGQQIQLNANWGEEGNFARLGPQQTAMALRLTGRPNSSNIGIHIDTQDRVGIGRVPDSGYALDVAGAGRVGGPLVVSNKGEGAKLLELDSERGWAFYQRGTAASSRLELRALTAGKWFDIAGVGGGHIASFYGSDTNPAQVRLVPEGGSVRVGGSLTMEGGTITAPEIRDDVSRPYTRLEVSSRPPSSADQAPEGTLWAYTGSPAIMSMSYPSNLEARVSQLEYQIQQLQQE